MPDGTITTEHAFDGSNAKDIELVGGNVDVLLKIIDQNEAWLGEQIGLNTVHVRGWRFGQGRIDKSLLSKIADVCAVPPSMIIMNHGEAAQHTFEELIASNDVSKRVKPEGVQQAGELLEIPVGLIRPLPDQPRKFFDEEELVALAESIQSKGQETPGKVTFTGDNEFPYELTDGERRLRACVLGGVPTYLAFVKSGRALDYDERFMMSCVANFAKADHTPAEEIAMVVRLLKMGHTSTEITEALSRQAMWVSHRKAIADRATDELMAAIEAGGVPIAVAKEISDLDPSVQGHTVQQYLAGEIKLVDLRRMAGKVRQESGRSRSDSPSQRAKRVAGRMANWRDQLSVIREDLSPISGSILKSQPGAVDDLDQFIAELQAFKVWLEARPDADGTTYQS